MTRAPLFLILLTVVAVESILPSGPPPVSQADVMKFLPVLQILLIHREPSTVKVTQTIRIHVSAKCCDALDNPPAHRNDMLPPIAALRSDECCSQFTCCALELPCCVRNM
ncbi:hypothetical protein GWK47_038536 [Chionoecetes opilio]|uniref:Conotoxin n=1 Tax=Chionoecetes opilio TaxID=41210 RepID=A0A8J4YLS5_CHIOP|nr:hypothetical protein GWK47_038536 [Chionoecetes opilio]